MCEICRQNPCHPRCPNYTPQKSSRICSICGGGICDGEEYIQNDEGDYIHYGCIQGIRQLLEWLGYEIRENDEGE